MKRALLILAFLIASCSDSDDFIFDQAEQTEISISAMLSTELDSINRKGKADTIHPRDTLTFIAEIDPSRSIRMQKYYWTLDGHRWASEFSFRTNIAEPGHHKIALVLIDYFGDTLSDTLNVWVGNPPVLNDSLIIPLTGTQGLSPDEALSFAWNAYDPDSIYDIRYHFTLSNRSNDTLLDTTLSNSYLVYKKPFQPLETYHWQVSAYNEIGMEAQQTIDGTFHTKGIKDESCIIGEIQTSGHKNRHSSEKIKIQVSFIDTSGKAIMTDTLAGATNSTLEYKTNPIPAGTYKVVASSIDFSDYLGDSTTVKVLPSEVIQAKSLFLADMIPPTISSVKDNADTLDLGDTLLFHVEDNGDNLSPEDISVTFDSKSIDGTISLKNDTLVVPMTGAPHSTTFRLLTLSATDLSGNESKRSFYVKPDRFWFECNADTTIYEGEVLRLHVEDTNPYGFEPDSFYFDIFTTDQPITIHATNPYVSFLVTSGAFSETTNHVRTGVRYTNGIIKWREWNVTRSFTTRSK